ncbi:uncharacterized protein LOC120431776 [Culex pipiens pallens]|uniref:uncharacterized protein LOC120431776 n=1 Tax=Culex pipiens pallens TaxID=42434 RepID=UPI001954875D|nr:uncharacterized protein LOC120431776 [Culex pipiens pallens]
MVTSTTTLLALLYILLPASNPLKVALQLERFEQIGGEGLADTSRLRVRKYNRTEYVLNGTFTLFRDVDASYEATVRVAYSTLGNNQFNEYPMKVPRKRFCDMLVDEYVDYQFIWANRTSLPYVARGTREFCPFPKGEYWVRELTPDAGFIPPVVPSGLWRMTVEFWQDDELVVQGRFYYRVTKGLL